MIQKYCFKKTRIDKKKYIIIQKLFIYLFYKNILKNHFLEKIFYFFHIFNFKKFLKLSFIFKSFYYYIRKNYTFKYFNFSIKNIKPILKKIYLLLKISDLKFKIFFTILFIFQTFYLSQFKRIAIKVTKIKFFEKKMVYNIYLKHFYNKKLYNFFIIIIFTIRFDNVIKYLVVFFVIFVIFSKFSLFNNLLNKLKSFYIVYKTTKFKLASKKKPIIDFVCKVHNLLI